MSLSLSTKESSYPPVFETHPTEPALPAWKMELNAKLAAHRQRRPLSAAEEQQAAARTGPERVGDGSGRASLVAARVAERYAKAPSYSEFLAASAAAAAAAAETAAFAARQAHDAAESFARLSAERAAAEAAEARTEVISKAEVRSGAEVRASADAPAAMAAAARVDQRPATIEHPQPLPARVVAPPRSSQASGSLFGSGGGTVDAFAEATVPPAVGLPAKLIEFPRELVAARKSRPRIAEGPLVEAPLFDQADPASLRIFEVEGVAMGGEERRTGKEAGNEAGNEAANEDGSEAARPTRETRGSQSSSGSRLSTEPERGAPEWQSIRLGEHPVSRSADTGEAHAQGSQGGQTQMVLHTASLGDRAMAALVDAAVVGAAFLLFVLVFAACTAHPPVNKTALVCGAAIFVGMFLFYEWLFMSYGSGTLGMRYAQIAICTFEDENPTRQQMRRRVGASVLALLPLGLGFLWAVFDEDSLGWHDRMTRCYQRSYR